MSRKLTAWNDAVKIEMILQHLTYGDLEKKLNLSRTYLSAIINGRVSSETAENRISDFFNLPNGDFSIQVKYIPKQR